MVAYIIALFFYLFISNAFNKYSIIKWMMDTWIIHFHKIRDQMTICTMTITNKKKMLSPPTKVLANFIWILVRFLYIAGRMTFLSTIRTSDFINRVELILFCINGSLVLSNFLVNTYRSMCLISQTFKLFYS